MEQLTQKTMLVDQQPTIRPLSRLSRTVIFLLSVILFVICVPFFVFYATGYRFDFFEPENRIIITGGLYVGTQIDQSEIYVNNELVHGSRLFRRGTYIQNIVPGVQQVHVQAEGLQTWVKKVPVAPYIVTEVEAFLMPLRPQIRIISKYYDGEQQPVLKRDSSVLEILKKASSTQSFILASTTKQSNYIINPEYILLEDLFALTYLSTSSKTTNPDSNIFKFSGKEIKNTTTTAFATTTKNINDMSLFEKNEQLFAKYSGLAKSIPAYFCVPTTTLASTSELYGAHVAYEIEKKLTGPVPLEIETYDNNEKICRTEIRIDTRFQKPLSFYFLPNSTDYVLVHLAEGVFVVEIDDRAWQNVQLVYPASAEQVVVDNNRIYLKEDEVFIELYTTLRAY